VQWAELWAALDVGSDIALANAIAREIIAAGLENRDFIENATTGFDEYRAAVEPYTLAYAERETGVPADVIRTMAHEYGRARRAMICWTLGITEHHNAVDNVLALVNLSLLTGHVGRYGSGLNPLRGQNNVQGGGDMGALPDRLPGFQHVENDELRTKFDRAWKVPVPPQKGWHLSQMFEAMERGDLRALYVIGENPLQSEADQHHARHLLEGLEFLLAQDLFLTKTAELAHVVLPASAAWCESEGTVTNSERRVQRVRKAIEAPAGARDDLMILFDLAKRLGRDWGRPDSETIWNEVRGLRATTTTTRASSSSTAVCGSGRFVVRGSHSSRSSTIPPSTGSTPSFRCASPRDGGSTSTTPACRAPAIARRCVVARASTCPPRTPTVMVSARARSFGCGRAAARSKSPSAVTMACARASRS